MLFSLFLFFFVERREKKRKMNSTSIQTENLFCEEVDEFVEWIGWFCLMNRSLLLLLDGGSVLGWDFVWFFFVKGE